MKKGPNGCFGYIGDTILPSYMGIAFGPNRPSRRQVSTEKGVEIFRGGAMDTGTLLDVINHHMFLQKDDVAFFQGGRVDLQCIQCDHEIVAKTTSKSVPQHEVVCKVPQWVVPFIKTGQHFTVVDFVLQFGVGATTIESSQGELLPIFHPEGNWTNIAEGYAGIGGWSQGAELIGGRTVLMVERDEQTAYSCGCTWQIPAMYASETKQCLINGNLPERLILIDNVNSTWARFLAGVMRVGTWLYSPPCPPWSKAGKAAGLQALEGVAFAHTVMGFKISKPLCVNIENVPGLEEHSDFHIIKQLVDQSGYRIVTSNVDKVYPLLPIVRRRWLCTIMPKHCKIPQDRIDFAKRVGIPHEIPGIGKENSIGFAGCMQSHLHEWERDQCIPSQATLELMGRYDLLPANVRRLHAETLTSEQVLKVRTKTSRHCLPNVMAMQGSQHNLPISHLQEKGLHAFLIWDGYQNRFAMPFEIACAMGFKSSIVLPADFTSAWRITGNALASPHAALQCFRSHILMGEMSPFKSSIKGVFDLCTALRSDFVEMENFTVRKEGEWMELSHWSKRHPETINKHPVVVSDEEDPPPKRSMVSPTWECHDDDEHHKIPHAEPKEGEAMDSFIMFARQPEIGHLTHDDIKPMPDGLWEAWGQGGIKHLHGKTITKVVHDAGIWAMFVWTSANTPIADIIRQCLPHAVSAHFDCILADGYEVRFGTTIPNVAIKEIALTPAAVTRIASSPNHSKSFRIMVDVTWKFCDIGAFMAAELAVLLQTLVVKNAAGELLSWQDFVLAWPDTRFSVEMQASPLEMKDVKPAACVSEARHAIIEKEAPIMDVRDHAKPTHAKYVRFAARCPKWGSIRTTTLNKDHTVGRVVEELFSHFPPDRLPRLTVDQQMVPNGVLIQDLIQMGKIEIFFPGGRPWPVTRLMILEPFTAFQLPPSQEKYREEMVTLDVKGPFDYRSSLVMYPVGTTIVEVAASFAILHRSNLTMFVTQNGKRLDARLKVEEVTDGMPVPVPIHVRVCALPGGAKMSVDEVQKLLSDMLTKRGVPENVCTSRVGMITSKISLNELRNILQKDDQAAWEDLKKHANDSKMRLITSQELKTHQKAQRAAKTAANKQEGASSSQSKKPKSSSVEPKQVTIDVAHFHAEGQRVPVCELNQFGPDMRGVAIVTPDQAQKFLPRTRLSSEPLALLVLSPHQIAEVEPVQIPATDIKGLPILTFVVILNFGDVDVELFHQVPSTTITETPMSVLEITIHRNLVTKWEDVQNPLNYLGLHLPEIRSGQVVSTWNLRCYDSNRQKCKHNEGAYVHGFVKIPSHNVDITLGRSGLAGIFIQAKAENKKPDPAFGIITMYGQQLEDVLKTAAKVPDTLGVVQINHGHFAIRGRREKLAEIRRKVMPQSIALQEGSVAPNSRWWHLKNMHTSATCANLTKALVDLGWEASAVRPINKTTWLVAAVDDPPSVHLCINDSFVAVVPLAQREKTLAGGVPHVVPMALQGNFAFNPDDAEMDSTAPSSTRLGEIQGDLEVTMAAMIDEKMKECDRKINGLQQAIEANQKEWKQSHEQTSSAVQNVVEQVSSFESTFASANNQMMSQMQSMFAKMEKMQTNFSSKLDTKLEAIESASKRSRSRGKDARDS